MTDNSDDQTGHNDVKTFVDEAQEQAPGLLGEYWLFLCENKKWWITPIVIALMLVGLLILLGSAGGAAPFIYTLF